MQKDKCNVFRHNFLSSQILGLLALNICSRYYESMLNLQHAFKVVFLGNDDIINYYDYNDDISIIIIIDTINYYEIIY